MAADSLDRPLARNLLSAAAAAGCDLASALAGGDDALRPTEIAQPALFLVEAVLAEALPRDLEIIAVAGHSVGEYAACFAAGVFDAPTGMGLVIERGRAMAQMREGTMAAVMGLDPEKLDAICRESGETVVIANFNSTAQTIISGTAAGVAKVSEAAQKGGAKRVVPLNVSGAFHSPLMQGAAAEFSKKIDAATFAAPQIPIVSNIDGRPHESPLEIRDLLRQQMTSAVRWIDCVNSLKKLGADAIVEVGPGSVLTGLNRRIVDLNCISVSTIDAAQDLNQQLGAAVNG